MRYAVFGGAVLSFAFAVQGGVRAEDAAGDMGNRHRDLENITVEGHRVTDAVANKSDIPLIETPQAISVVTAEMIAKRGITDLADALRTVGGVSRSSTYGYYDAYQIRGFDAAYGSVYLDGLLTGNVAGANNELAGLERIEVVKGPASMLFGSAPLGGIVNLVSKRPRPDAFLDASVATGSYNLIETALDANAPIIGDRVLARLNVLYRNSDDFVKYSDKDRIYIAPAVTFNLGDRTKFTVLGRYERNHDSPWSPVSAWGTVLPNANGSLPIDFSVNNPGAQHAIHNQNYKHIGYAFDHEFSDWLSFSQTLRYVHRKVYWNNWNFVAGFVDNNIVNGVQQGRVIGRYIYGPFRETDKDFGVDSRFTLKFETGIVRHNIIAGIDYRRNTNDAADEGGNFDPAVNPLDAFNPDYSAPLIHDPAAGYALSGKSHQTGVYLQDHLNVGPRVTVTLGGRYDWAEADGEKDEKFSPRVGMTYTLKPGLALYTSWSRSFTPQSTYFTVAGTSLPPETGRNVEVGLKVATPDGTLNGMVSLFELKRENVATSDPANPFFYVVTGAQRSRGLEVEAIWSPTPPWTLAFAYTYLDATVTRDNLFRVGAQLANVPRHNVNLYGEYVIPSGPLENLGLSIGLLYNSSKNATLFPEDIDFDGVLDPISLFRLPSYTIVDAGLSYRFDDWKIRLNVNNIFDKRYFPDACCLDRVTPGEPRNWRLAVMRSF